MNICSLTKREIYFSALFLYISENQKRNMTRRKKGREEGGKQWEVGRGGELGRITREIIILQAHYGHPVLSE